MVREFAELPEVIDTFLNLRVAQVGMIISRSYTFFGQSEKYEEYYIESSS